MILFWNFCLLALFCPQLMCKKAGDEDTELKNELNTSQSDSEASFVNNAHNQSSDILIRRPRSDTYREVTRNKPAIQSSTMGEGIASLAVDGDTNVDMYKHSCTQTWNKENEWWAVDLGRNIAVSSVRITNRADCCADRLKNFYVVMTNVSPWTTRPPVIQHGNICHYYAGPPPPGIPIDINCDKTVQGRYLFIMLSKPDHLTICELEVTKYSIV